MTTYKNWHRYRKHPAIAIGPSVIIQLRQRYLATHNTKWPFTDELLAEMWFATKNKLGISQQTRGVGAKPVYDPTLTWMRNHHVAVNFDAH